MTEKQKEKVRTLRLEGAGYKAIAAELKLSLNTVKSYCRRTLLIGYGKTVAINNLVSVEKGLVCKCCNKKLKHLPGKKRKIFCSDNCRKKYWKKKNQM